MSYLIGVDTGGTFTDIVTADKEGNIGFYKASTTPGRIEGVLNALKVAAEGNGVSLSHLLGETSRFIYSSTFATNTIVERVNDGKVGVLTTKGFRDTLAIRRAIKKSTYDIQEVYPEPLVRRGLIKEVNERVDAEGKIVVPLKRAEVYPLVEELIKEKVIAIIVCLIHSYMNPAHERELKRLIRTKYPGMCVYCSSDICPEMREYERMSTTVFAGYVGPAVETHLSKLQSRLGNEGLKVEPFVMQSNQGIQTTRETIQKPVGMLFSGPTGGVLGCSFIAKHMGISDVITADMGGTSFDVGMIKDGKILTATLGELEGWPLLGRRVEVHSIGAGGGSIAGVDPQGALYVGPRSAGSEPGPACYDKGGTEPTVTDADVVLGYIDPNYFLGGKIKLNAKKAYKAIKEKIADKVGIDPIQAASGIYNIVNAKMADAMRVLSSGKGLDPRDFVFICFGGAGPLHGASLHRELNTKKLVVPKIAPCLSAFGVVSSYVRDSHSRTLKFLLNNFDLEQAKAFFDEMEEEVVRVLQDAKIGKTKTKMYRAFDMSYKGQLYELEVPIAGKDITRKTLEKAKRDFMAKHQSIYGFSEDEDLVQIVTLRLEGVGEVPEPIFRKSKVGKKSPKATLREKRDFYLPEEKKFVTASIYNGDSVTPGNEMPGPAVIQYPQTNIVLFPGQVAVCDEWENIVIT